MSNKVIAFANQKGGVGKTTSCVNTAASLAALKYKILLIDLDPQGNATTGSGINKNKLSLTLNEVLLGEIDIQKALQKIPSGYFVLPSNGDLTAAEVALVRKPKQESRLKTSIASIEETFDFILIDCPPALNMLTLNAFVAAQSVIIPMQCEYYALEGLSALIHTVEQVKSTLNAQLKIEGVLRTLYDPRSRLSTEVSAQLIGHFGNRVYQTVIPRNIRLAEAPSHGLPVLLYDKLSKGSEAYLAFAKEILARRKHRVAEPI